MVKLNFCSLVAIAIAATPTVTFAQNRPAAPPPQAANPAQQRQLQVQQIKAQIETQIQEVLTSDQQIQYRQSRRRGTGILDTVDSLPNLSQEQKNKIDAIVRKGSERILQISGAGRSQRR